MKYTVKQTRPNWPTKWSTVELNNIVEQNWYEYIKVVWSILIDNCSWWTELVNQDYTFTEDHIETHLSPVLRYAVGQEVYVEDRWWLEIECISWHAYISWTILFSNEAIDHYLTAQGKPSNPYPKVGTRYWHIEYWQVKSNLREGNDFDIALLRIWNFYTIPWQAEAQLALQEHIQEHWKDLKANDRIRQTRWRFAHLWNIRNEWIFYNNYDYHAMQKAWLILDFSKWQEVRDKRIELFNDRYGE